jgi:translation initiation factor 4E
MKPMHKLSDTWIVWAHLPQNPSWTEDSYIPIMKITHVEEMIALTQALSETLIVKCMLFLMKENIMPMWEDSHNKNGGCFSYKLTSRINDSWRDISYSLIGQTLTKLNEFNKDITGISISPKKNFCILKIWMGSCTHQDPTKISILKSDGCIFKKH